MGVVKRVLNIVRWITRSFSFSPTERSDFLEMVNRVSQAKKEAQPCIELYLSDICIEIATSGGYELIFLNEYNKCTGYPLYRIWF